MIPSYVLIIGSMKSGTTTLFDLLAAHPMIAPCSDKEPGFFAFEHLWRRGFTSYEQLFDFNPDQHVYGLDASTDYTKHPHCVGVADRLASSAPRRFKLIYLMRHPLRRIESHARHTQIARREVGRQISPRADHGLGAGVSPVSMSISRYAHQLDQYRDAFAKGDVLLLSFEELVGNQRDVLRRVYKFLQIPEVPSEEQHSNVAGGVSEPVAMWLFLARLKAFASIVKALTPTWFRRAIRRMLSRKPRIRGRFRLTQEEEVALMDELRPDVERLRDEYGFDVADWLRPRDGS